MKLLFGFIDFYLNMIKRRNEMPIIARVITGLLLDSRVSLLFGRKRWAF